MRTFNKKEIGDRNMTEFVRTEFMSVDDVCKYLKASRSTVYKLAQSGKIPCHKFGRLWRFDQEQIDEWLGTNEGADALQGELVGGGGAERRDSTDAGSKESNSAKASGESKASGGADDSLEGLGLSEAQIATLRAFSLTTPIQLVISMSTEAGRAGLRGALGISSEELDAIAQKLTAKRRK